MQKTNYPCWWCGKELMKINHATLPDGRKVHLICEKDALAYLKPVTAQPSDIARKWTPDA
jgi:hypothetical protein